MAKKKHSRYYNGDPRNYEKWKKDMNEKANRDLARWREVEMKEIEDARKEKEQKEKEQAKARKKAAKAAKRAQYRENKPSDEETEPSSASSPTCPNYSTTDGEQPMDTEEEEKTRARQANLDQERTQYKDVNAGSQQEQSRAFAEAKEECEKARQALDEARAAQANLEALKDEQKRAFEERARETERNEAKRAKEFEENMKRCDEAERKDVPEEKKRTYANVLREAQKPRSKEAQERKRAKDKNKAIAAEHEKAFQEKWGKKPNLTGKMGRAKQLRSCRRYADRRRNVQNNVHDTGRSDENADHLGGKRDTYECQRAKS